MKFFKYLSAIVCMLPISFIKPPLLRLLGHSVGARVKIGVSCIFVDRLYLSNDVRIGNGNIISIRKLVMREASQIRNMNFISGYFDIWMKECSTIININMISRGRLRWMKRCPKLYIGKRSQISTLSSVDLAETVWLGNDTVFAGKGIQLWTHGFIHLKDRSRNLICGSIKIGDNVYIGARSCISAGVKIEDNISVGAQSSVAKNLFEEGLYVSSSLRLIDKLPEERMSGFEKKSDNGFEYWKK